MNLPFHRKNNDLELLYEMMISVSLRHRSDESNVRGEEISFDSEEKWR